MRGELKRYVTIGVFMDFFPKKNINKAGKLNRSTYKQHVYFSLFCYFF